MKRRRNWHWTYRLPGGIVISRTWRADGDDDLRDRRDQPHVGQAVPFLGATDGGVVGYGPDLGYTLEAALLGGCDQVG